MLWAENAAGAVGAGDRPAVGRAADPASLLA